MPMKKFGCFRIQGSHIKELSDTLHEAQWLALIKSHSALSSAIQSLDGMRMCRYLGKLHCDHAAKQSLASPLWTGWVCGRSHCFVGNRWSSEKPCRDSLLPASRSRLAMNLARRTQSPVLLVQESRLLLGLCPEPCRLSEKVDLVWFPVWPESLCCTEQGSGA